MLAKIKSLGLQGISGYNLDIEVDLNQGLPGYEVVGLADTAIKESKERVKSAIKNSGLSYPTSKITVNLAPADTKKEGPIYDLPIALGILACSRQLDISVVKEFIFFGELSLDGTIRKINGVLPLIINAKQLGFKKFVIPAENKKEASYIEGIEVYPVASLGECVRFLKNPESIKPLETNSFEVTKNKFSESNDFKFVQGQAGAKRALEIAAAGGHNVIMIGPPGSGKTMLAKCFPTILPDLTFEEALEVTKIHSIAGVLETSVGIVTTRPIRSPHHTASAAALTGGGKNAKPGEISLAHNGVLFLDELPEYSRYVLETMRQPLEDGVITVARVAQTIEYPANFILLASMNPCPCGNYGSKKLTCKCTPNQIHNYLSKLSGPLMDRIDLHIHVDAVEFEDLAKTTEAETSEQIKKRVDACRQIQLERYKGSKVVCNSKMTVKDAKQCCQLSKECEELLKSAFERLNLSARAHNRILKVARTIADLEGSKNIETAHIAEAIRYRSLDTKFWI